MFTNSFLDSRFKRSNTISQNQNYVCKVLGNSKTRYSDKIFLCGYVRDNRELFVPVRLGDPELEFKINGSADPDFIRKINQMVYWGPR